MYSRFRHDLLFTSGQVIVEGHDMQGEGCTQRNRIGLAPRFDNIVESTSAGRLRLGASTEPGEDEREGTPVRITLHLGPEVGWDLARSTGVFLGVRGDGSVHKSSHTISQHILW